MGCDAKGWGSALDAVVFQSTHPSGVRHDMPAQRVSDWLISIHAPQWGATLQIPALMLVWVISIHAPQWGATGGYGSISRQTVISIHAPQWGATHRLRSSSRMTFDFNPRTPVGCDRIP